MILRPGSTVSNFEICLQEEKYKFGCICYIISIQFICAVVVVIMVNSSMNQVKIPSECQYSIRLQYEMHNLPEPSSLQGSTSVREHLNMNIVTGACS